MQTRLDAIDLPALRLGLRETADAIRPLKQRLRTRWSRDMSTGQRTLVELKRRATLLCVLRALVRGRHHLRRPLAGDGAGATGETWDARAYHLRLAERAIDRYGLILPPGPASAAERGTP